MTLLSSGALASLRAIQDSALPDTLSVLRYTETNTPDGVEHGWAVVASGVRCRVSRPQRAATERAGEGAVLRAVSDWVIWLPFETDVTEKDRLTVTGSDRTDGRTFEVESVGEKSNETARACGCVLVV